MLPDPNTIVQPADCLVYRPSSLFGWVIAVKTWTKVSHVEAYFGRQWSLGAREQGVNYYRWREDHLCRILRPKEPFDMPQAMGWFGSVIHQKYDYLGLLCFTLAVRQGAQDRMFCSEFLTRWYRAGSFEAFSPEYDADHIAPAQFLQSPEFKIVWDDGQAL